MEENREVRWEYEMSDFLPFCVLEIFTSFHTMLAKFFHFTKEENRFTQYIVCGVCKKSTKLLAECIS